MHPTFQKLVATLLVFILTTSFLFCQYEAAPLPVRTASESVDGTAPQFTYTEGMRDGELDAKGNPVYGCGGFACGVFGFLAAALSDPKPSPQLLVQMEESKGKDYCIGYQMAYSKKAKKQNMIFAGAGWVIGAAVSLAIMANSEPAEAKK